MKFKSFWNQKIVLIKFNEDETKTKLLIKNKQKCVGRLYQSIVKIDFLIWESVNFNCQSKSGKNRIF